MKVKITITCDNDITKNLFEEVIEVDSIEEAQEITQKEFDKISGEFSDDSEIKRSSKGYPIGYFDMKGKSNTINSLSFENGSNGLVAMNHARFMVNIFYVNSDSIKVSKEQFIKECNAMVINWHNNYTPSLPIQELCPVLNCNSFVVEEKVPEGIEESFDNPEYCEWYDEQIEEIQDYLWSERVDIKGYEYIN